MPIRTADVIWMDGQLVPWDEAQVHVLTHGLHYGTGVLEGTRAYPTPSGPAIFRLDDHLDRLFRSAHILGLPMPHTRETLRAATLDLVATNGFQSCYLRHLVFIGYGEMGMDIGGAPIQATIAAWDWAGSLAAGAHDRGLEVMISSWRRSDANVVPPSAKATGPYLGSVLARAEASASGYDEALLLSAAGHVSECTSENVFLVRDDALYTPPSSAGALEGITQDSVRRIAADLGLPVHTRTLVRSDLYTADEIFLCGTAAEIAPVRTIDGRVIGGWDGDTGAGPGPVTRKLRETFDAAVHGRDDRYADWLSPLA